MALGNRWQTTEEALEAEVECADFAEAMRLVNQIAELAETYDHHPDIYVHDYKYVHVTLRSHDSGGVTDRDRQLATAIDHAMEQ